MRFGTAVVGLGVGEAHARAYAAMPDCELRWVADLDAARAGRLADELGCKATTTFETLLQDPDVQIVSVASYDDAHAEQVTKALGSGRDVFAEKPIARTERELADVKAVWLQSGRHLASNLVLRAAPLYGQLRDTISRGELGEIYAFDGDYLYGRLEKITDGWRGDVDDVLGDAGRRRAPRRPDDVADRRASASASPPPATASPRRGRRSATRLRRRPPSSSRRA